MASFWVRVGGEIGQRRRFSLGWESLSRSHRNMAEAATLATARHGTSVQFVDLESIFLTSWSAVMCVRSNGVPSLVGHIRHASPHGWHEMNLSRNGSKIDTKEGEFVRLSIGTHFESEY